MTTVPGEDDVGSLRARITALEERLWRVEARQAVEHLMYHYIRGCDLLKDATYISSLFTEDAVWEGQGHLAEFGRTVGREEIRQMFVENPTMLPFTAHYLTNAVVTLSLDGTKAYGQWHTLEAATLKGGAAQVWMLAFYDNDFLREGDDWRIRHIRYRDMCVVPYEDGWLKTEYVSPLTLTKLTRL
jgi:hypothetical protein